MKGSSNKRKSHLDTIGDELEVEGLQYNRKDSRKPSQTFDGYLKADASGDDSEMDGEVVSYAPDGGWGWVVVFASFLSNFVLDGISLTHGVMMDNIIVKSKEGGKPMTTSTYSLVGSVLLGVTLLVGPLVSFLTNKFGFRSVAVTGSVLAALGVILSWAVSPHVPNWEAFLIFYGILTGVGFGMMFQISVVIVGLYFEKKRALATGLAICGTGFGTFMWAPVVEYITENFGWQITFIFEASVILFSALFGFLYKPLPTKVIPKTEKRRPSVTYPLPINVNRSEQTLSERLQRNLRLFCQPIVVLLCSPTFLIIAISGAITMFGFFIPFAFLTGRATPFIGQPAAAFLISIIGISNTVTRILIGYLSDKPWASPLIISNTALTVGGIATFCSVFVESHDLLIVYSVIFGASIGAFACLRSILIMEFLGIEKFNDGFGLSLFFMGIATFVGNPAIGYLEELTGNFDYTFYVGGGLLALSGILCYPLRIVSNWENSPKERQEQYSTNPMISVQVQEA